MQTILKINDNLFVEPLYLSYTNMARIFMSDGGHHLISVNLMPEELQDLIACLIRTQKNKQ